MEKEPCAPATLKQVHSNSAVFEECMKVFRIFICQPPVHENWCRQNSGVSDDEKEQKKLDMSKIMESDASSFTHRSLRLVGADVYVVISTSTVRVVIATSTVGH